MALFGGNKEGRITLGRFEKVSELKIALSIRRLSLMLRAGVALSDAIAIMAEKTADKSLKKIYTQVSKDVQAGMNLSDSMAFHKKAFSKIIISIIGIGEKGGTLESNLVFLADYLKKRHELNKKIKGALLYPSIVLFLTVIELSGVIFLILPKLDELFSGFDEVPVLTTQIIAMSVFLNNNIQYILIVLLILFLLLRQFLKTNLGIRIKDRLAVSTPIVKKIVRNNVLATYSRTLNILLESGVPLVSALEISGNAMGNGVYKKILMDIHDEVKKGSNLAKMLTEYEKYFPDTYIRLIEVGETTGSLEENLVFLYEFHENEVEETSNNLATILEPILLIFVGCVIGLLAFIIIGPIYQFSNAIG